MTEQQAEAAVEAVETKMPFSLFPGVIIDDNKNHAVELQWALQAAGIVCTPLHYDTFDGLKNASFFERAGLRFVFLDINLAPGIPAQKPDAEHATHITKALSALNLRSPYVLVIWSDVQADPEKILPLAYSRAEPPITKPVGIEMLNKHDFMVDVDDGQKECKVDVIVERIQLILNKYPQLTALMHWEARTHHAAGRVTGHFFGILPDTTDEALEIAVKGAGDPDQSPLYDGERLAAMLNSVAVGAFGKQVPGKEASGAEAGLLPLLEDQLHSSIMADASYNSAWKQGLQLADTIDLSSEEKSKLNASLLLDFSQDNCIERGVWYDLSGWGNAPGFVTSFFGVKLADAAKNVFIAPKDGEFVSDDMKEVIDEAIKSSKIGLLSYSAPCDYAQGKDKLRKIFLCAIVPEDFSCCLRDNKSLYATPVLFFDQPSILLISFRYASGLPVKQKNNLVKGGTPYFRVRDQLLAEVSARYSAYLSRPGLISV